MKKQSSELVPRVDRDTLRILLLSHKLNVAQKEFEWSPIR